MADASLRDIKITLTSGTAIKTVSLGVCYPFVKIKSDQFELVSEVANGSSPTWKDQLWHVYAIPLGAQLTFEVWHCAVLGDDKVLQTGTFTIPSELTDNKEVEIPLVKAKNSESSGALHITFDSKQAQSNKLRTSCRYSRHSSSLAGVLTATWNDGIIPTYNVYELKLKNVSEIFNHVKQHWNLKYDSAQTIFGDNPQSEGVREIIKSQHGYLYAKRSTDKNGYIHSAQDFLELINFGLRFGATRFFTYALMEDGMYFSESSTEFTRDFFSKHAMHSNCSEEVFYAGEFLIYTNPETKESTLVIDNNSGTFAPSSALLPQLKEVFNFNLPDLKVEVYDRADPQLAAYTKELVDKSY